jgi:hypothetical protein
MDGNFALWIKKKVYLDIPVSVVRFKSLDEVFSRYVRVTKTEIVKIVSTIMHMPAIYHSRVDAVPPSAISARARNRNIRAITEKNPSTAVTVAENFSLFMMVLI